VNTPTVRIEHPHGSNGAGEQFNPRSGAESHEVFECSYDFTGGEGDPIQTDHIAEANRRATGELEQTVAADGAESLTWWVNPDGSEKGIL
jgi:hypothetical protein